MTAEEIPADEVIEMTKPFYKAFQSVGCTPGCHCCGKALKPGVLFKLATVKVAPITHNSHCLESNYKEYLESSESHEVMLCDQCTAEMYNKKQQQRLKSYVDDFNALPAYKKDRMGCHRINGKLIH